MILNRAVSSKSVSRAGQSSRHLKSVSQFTTSGASNGFAYRRTLNDLAKANPDIASVHELEYWECKYSSDIKNKLDQAKIDLHKKLNHEDLVQETLQKRKNNSKSVSTLDNFKDQSKHFKLFEETLMTTYKEISLELTNCLQTRESLRKKGCELKEEIQQYNIQFDKINRNLPSFTKDPPAPLKRQSDIAQYLSQKQSYKESLSKQRQELQQNIEMLQIEISHISRELVSIDENTSRLRKELRIVRNEIIHHYSTLLKQGTDTRNEGLSWIVKVLLSLKVEIRKDMMPVMVDDKSFEVVVSLARKSLELDGFYDKLAESKGRKVENSKERPEISQRLQKLKQNIRIRKPKYMKKRISWTSPEMLNTETQSVASFNSNVIDAIKTEEHIKLIKNNMLQIQISEVKRLTRECLKSGNSIRNSISLIVGVENIEKFMIVSLKEVKEFEAIKESTSTFSFTARLIPKPKIADYF